MPSYTSPTYNPTYNPTHLPDTNQQYPSSTVSSLLFIFCCLSSVRVLWKRNGQEREYDLKWGVGMERRTEDEWTDWEEGGGWGGGGKGIGKRGTT